MALIQEQSNRRSMDTYMDRRCGDDRRQVHHLDFFSEGGAERRIAMDRRNTVERRKDCIQITKWRSVCAKVLD